MRYDKYFYNDTLLKKQIVAIILIKKVITDLRPKRLNWVVVLSGLCPKVDLSVLRKIFLHHPQLVLEFQQVSKDK